MLQLLADPARFAAETGLKLPEYFLLTGLSLDGWPTVQPLLVRTARGTFTLVRDIERGYIASANLPSAIRPVYYQPYWHVEKIAQKRSEPANIVAALQQVAGGEAEVAVDGHLSLTHLANFSQAFTVRLPEQPAPGPGYTAYFVDRDAVLERFARGRDGAVALAARLADDLGVAAAVTPLFTPADDRFSSLDTLMAGAGLEFILAASPLDVQELTGLPSAPPDRGLLAVYQRGAAGAWVLVPEGVAPPAYGRRESLDLARLAADPTAVGVQGDYMTVDLTRRLGLPLAGWASAMALLRRWREARSGFDLPYYMLAMDATRNGVEGSLAMARAELAAGRKATEKELETSHFKLVTETLAKHGLGHSFVPYWTSIHSGTRSLTPAPATEQALGPAIKCLRWDCGIRLYDADGLLRGVSDIARNIVWDPAAAALREKLDRIMLEQIIPACRTGATGRDIYMVAVNAVAPLLPEFRAAGLLPPYEGSFAANFTRDVGHVFGKEEPVTFAFAYDHAEQKLATGTMAAVEWQWFVAGTPLACEDVLVVTPEGGVNLTRRVK